MTTYVMLATWTEQGIRDIGRSPARLDALKKQLEEMGGRFVAFYMTLGEYDFVLVYETPDEAVAARFALLLGRLGNIRTKTMKAFSERAYREIVVKLGNG
jgi:uncharacterized protein with GYD domain